MIPRTKHNQVHAAPVTNTAPSTAYLLLIADAKYLEDELDVVSHGNPVTVGQGEDLVVIEHGVEVFDPDGVHRSVADYPLSLPKQKPDKVVPRVCVHSW